MSSDELTYKGADRETLIEVAKRAISILSGKEPKDIKLDEDGDLLLINESAGIWISFETDPAALIFRAILLNNVKESPALYILINEINADIAIGQMYYHEKEQDIRYYYKYLAENPSPELVATILSSMLDGADLYDDRLKMRLGGERFNEQADDEIDI